MVQVRLLQTIKTENQLLLAFQLIGPFLQRIQTESTKDGVTTQSLKWVTLNDGKSITIWEGGRASNFVFDKSSSQLAFIVEDKINNQAANSFWYYKAGTDKAVMIANNKSPGIDEGLQLGSINACNNNTHKKKKKQTWPFLKFVP